MEIILQNETNGMFLGEEREWVEQSDDARKFITGSEAVRFARAARFGGEVRIVARYRESRNAILLPLIGSLAQY